MFSVLPVKFGVPDGVGVEAARGALHAAIARRATTSGARKRMAFGMCTSPAVGASLGRSGSMQTQRAPRFRGGHPASLLVGLGDERRGRHPPSAFLRGPQNQKRRRDGGADFGGDDPGFYAPRDPPLLLSP